MVVRLVAAVFVLLGFSIIAQAESATSAAENPVGKPLNAGLYEIRGQHSRLGSYSGRLLVKADGAVQRMITIRFENDSQRTALGLRDASCRSVQLSFGKAQHR
jgi:hypothetical protein